MGQTDKALGKIWLLRYAYVWHLRYAFTLLNAFTYHDWHRFLPARTVLVPFCAVEAGEKCIGVNRGWGEVGAEKPKMHWCQSGVGGSGGGKAKKCIGVNRR